MKLKKLISSITICTFILCAMQTSAFAASKESDKKIKSTVIEKFDDAVFNEVTYDDNSRVTTIKYDNGNTEVVTYNPSSKELTVNGKMIDASSILNIAKDTMNTSSQSLTSSPNWRLLETQNHTYWPQGLTVGALCATISSIFFITAGSAKTNTVDKYLYNGLGVVTNLMGYVIGYSAPSFSTTDYIYYDTNNESSKRVAEYMYINGYLIGSVVYFQTTY